MIAWWNAIPTSVRAGVILICLGCGTMGVLAYEGAWVIAAVGLGLAVIDLLIGHHANDNDHHRQSGVSAGTQHWHDTKPGTAE